MVALTVEMNASAMSPDRVLAGLIATAVCLWIVFGKNKSTFDIPDDPELITLDTLTDLKAQFDELLRQSTEQTGPPPDSEDVPHLVSLAGEGGSPAAEPLTQGDPYHLLIDWEVDDNIEEVKIES